MVNQNEITLAGFVVCSVKMPLPLLTRHFVEKKLSAYCQQKVPAHILHQVRLTFVVDGSTVTLIEARHTHAQPGTWVQRPIARFLFTAETACWTLYSPHSRAKDAWQIYPDAKPVKAIDTLLKVVDEDPHGLFWG